MADETEALLSQAEALAEKLRDFRTKHARESDAAAKFKLAQEIKDGERELAEIRQQLATQHTYLIYQAVLRLDYKQQSIQYEQTVETNRPALFILRGPPEHGQSWLLHRLLRKMNVPPVHVVLTRRTKSISVDALWRELGNRLFLSPKASHNDIAAKLFARWATQHVVILVWAIGATSREYIDEVVESFWRPLTNLAEQQQPRPPHRFLMFLVDEDGGSLSWDLCGVDECDAQWKSDLPIRLETLKAFEQQMISKWVDSCEELPRELYKRPNEAAIQILNNMEEGIPEEVLATVCELCGMEYEFLARRMINP